MAFLRWQPPITGLTRNFGFTDSIAFWRFCSAPWLASRHSSRQESDLFVFRAAEYHPEAV